MRSRPVPPRPPHKSSPPSMVPGWGMAGVICGALLIAVFVANTIGNNSDTSEDGLSLICFPLQLLVYFFNGWLAGRLENDRYVKKRRLNPLTPRPNYLIIGAAAGLVMALIAAIVYLCVDAAVISLAPAGKVLLGSSVVGLIIIDAVAAIGLGSLGGMIYSRLFSR